MAVGAGSERGQSEPLEAISGARPNNPFPRQPQGHLRAKPIDTSFKRTEPRVESAMRRLDLSKLTMADFGDVEPSR